MAVALRKIELTADEWNLFGDYSGSEGSALKINEKFNVMAVEAFDILESHGQEDFVSAIRDGKQIMKDFMKTQSKSGADDIETLTILDKQFIGIFGRENINAIKMLPVKMKGPRL